MTQAPPPKQEHTRPSPAKHPGKDSDQLTIELADCNNIAAAQVALRRNALNIKYGPNGTGKSTLARALTLQTEGQTALQELIPFRCRNGDEIATPTVTGADEITSVLVFNEEYVSQFVFQADEVVENSFEIFVKTPEYEQGIQELDVLFVALTDLFRENEALDQAIASFEKLRDAFIITKSGTISKTSKGFKAIGMGGKLSNIPPGLGGFAEFLGSDDPAGWLSWQSKGTSYLDLSDKCPFCSTVVDKRTASQVSEEFDSAAVRNLSALRETIEGLARFFAPDRLEQLRAVTSTLEGLTPEQQQLLVTTRDQIDVLLTKFRDLKQVSFPALREADDVGQAFGRLHIDLELLDILKSESTTNVVSDMNDALDSIAAEIDEVKRRIGIQKSQTAITIEQNSADINDFLTSAGYKYSVRIETTGETYRMIIEHVDAPGHLQEAHRHLSFGERNAFALVLFLHQARRERPDLVILDDPVSSFDKTKKYAILHKMFHGKKSLRDFTTLFLTHDIEPAIDIVRISTSQQFQAAQPTAHFLRSVGGTLTEKPIRSSDIVTFSQVCDANITASADPVIRCIYLRRRFEVHGDRGGAYDVLSSLLHGRTKPSRKEGRGQLEELSEPDVEVAVEAIRRFIPDFDYGAILAEVTSSDSMVKRFGQTEVGYEKVQLFRVMTELDPMLFGSDVAFKKFVNETYHIENEYVMQLDPREFDTTPEHVVERCTELLASRGGTSAPTDGPLRADDEPTER